MPSGSRAGRAWVGIEKMRWRSYRIFDRWFPRFRAGAVSILIPALESRADLLDTRSLASIDRQTFQAYEVIVVSETYSQEIADAVGKRDSRYRYLWGTSKPRSLRRAGSLALWCSGAAPNLNLALKEACGEYFARMDDDDEWLPRHLDLSVTALERSGADFVSSNAYAPDNSLIEVNDLANQDFRQEFNRHQLTAVVGTTITWVYKRHLRAYRFNASSWKKKINRPVDYDFMLRIAAGGARLFFNPEITAQQCLRPGVGNLTGHRAYEAEQRVSSSGAKPAG